MDYKTWEHMQLDTPIIKPIHYHIGEWIALQEFSKYWSPNLRILDVGCGIGYGVGMMNKIGFHNVTGIDINKDKIELGKRLGYNLMFCDILDANRYFDSIDIIWCSHTFEHMLNPGDALQRMMEITTKSAKFYFILPYPDLNPSPVHSASKIIGTNINDFGDTLISWFNQFGLIRNYSHMDNFREPEVWLELEKVWSYQ